MVKMFGKRLVMRARIADADGLITTKEDEEEKKKLEEDAWVLNPAGTFMRRWDLFMLVLLIFTATITPYEVAFLQPAFDALFVINRSVDLGFIVDMILNFFVGYTDSSSGQWVWEKKKIARRYLTGWFFIDLVSILPFDTLGLVMESDSVAQLKVLRIVRLLRLIKLLRVFRSSRIFRRIQMSMGLTFSTFSMLKLLAYVLVVVHWTACLWNLGPQMEDAAVNWRSELASSWSSGELYLACLDFSLQAMVMGYGDFVPVTHVERAIGVFCMVVGGSVYAYVIGDICGVVANRDPATSEYQQNVDLLNQYMDENQLPQELRVKLREYFLYCKDLLREQYYHDLLDQMSPELKGTVAHFRNGAWIAKIKFFNADDADERHAFVTVISTRLEPVAFSPNELVFREGDAASHMYIVTRGLVGSQGRIKKKEDFFGEDMIAGLILANPRRVYSARSLTFLDVNVLSKERLEAILESGDFSQTSAKIRRSAMLLAFKRTVMQIAAEYRAEMGIPMSTKAEIAEWKAAMDVKIRARRAASKAKKERERARKAEARQLRQQHRRQSLLAEEEKTPSGEVATVGESKAGTGGAGGVDGDDAGSLLEDSLDSEAAAAAEYKRRRVANMNVLDFWNETRAVVEKEEPVILLSDIKAPQIDTLTQRLATLEVQVGRLAEVMESGFDKIEGAQETLFRACREAARRSDRRGGSAVAAAAAAGGGSGGGTRQPAR